MRILPLFALPLLAACGPPQEPWGAATGRITLEGKPLADVTVVFSSNKKGVHLSAQTDSEGRYTIRSAKFPGLPIGTYQVLVVAVPRDPPAAKNLAEYDGPPPKMECPFDSRYGDAKTTDLSAEVKEGKNQFDFPLRPKS